MWEMIRERIDSSPISAEGAYRVERPLPRYLHARFPCSLIGTVSNTVGVDGKGKVRGKKVRSRSINADEIVDSADVRIIVDHWGEDYPLCDIGPMPWGDGIVVVQDLVVLINRRIEK